MLGNKQIKYIQSLGHKKARDEQGLFVAEGPRIVEDILHDFPEAIVKIYAMADWLNDHGEAIRGFDTIVVQENELDRISQLTTPNKVMAVVKKFPVREPGPVKNNISLMLDTIQDPGNLGTIIRIADWFGIAHIICSSDCADMYNPKVVQSTMGSIARVNVFYTDPENWIRENPGIEVFASALHGIPVNEIGRIREGVIIIGNESRGIRESLINLAVRKVTIPGKGRAESLNAAVATGIILSHLM